MWPFKPKQKSVNNQKFKLLVSQNGTSAIFGDYGDEVLKNDTVIQSISVIAREIKKLQPRHVKTADNKKIVVNDSINRLLRRPNKNMSTADFLEAVIWRLYGKDNCFIWPKYEVKVDANGTYSRQYSEMYILHPIFTTFYVDDNNQILEVEFQFANDVPNLRLNYQEIIHLKRNFGLNELFGGDKFGRPNNDALIKTIKISESLLEGIQKGAEASQSIQGAIKYNVLLDDGDMAKHIEKFNEHLKKNESGIIGLDLAGEYIPVSRDVKLVDVETVEYTDKKIYRNYGVSQPVLDGTATPEELRAFYNTLLESLKITFEQAFENCLLTWGQISRGHSIVFYHDVMATFSTEEQFEQYKELMDRGAMTPNEARDRLGLVPIDGGDEPIMSLNYIKKSDASRYQLGKAGAHYDEHESQEESDKDESGEAQEKRS